MKAVKEIVKFIIFPFVFGIGLIAFLFTKRTNNMGYVAFRYLFVLTNGKVNDRLSRIIHLFSKPKAKTAKGILGDLSEKQINEICASISKNGYFEFDVTLNQSQIDSLYHFATTEKTHCIDVNQKGIVYMKNKVVFDEKNPISPRYQFDSIDLVQNESVREIIFDPTFRTIAANYLDCQPILDIVTMWWSVPFNNKGTSQAAQMFHFDMDRFKFLKFFFYLTDVHTDNGPHCYIRGSHNGIPKQIRNDRRIDDNELTNFYPVEDIKEFVGKKGTILAVDTRGLHKGKPLTKDNRLLFQIQFSNSLFGAPFEQMIINNPSQEEISLMNGNKRTYQLMHS